jgi:hypothetical protein
LGGYDRPFALLNCRSTSAGMRPRAGTAIRFSVAQARITLGSRVPLADADDDFVGRPRRVVWPLVETGRPTFQYLSRVRSRDARFRLDRSSSRQSPFHPSVTVCAPSDPSRSSISTSTVAFAIGSCLSIRGSRSDAIGAVDRPSSLSRTARRQALMAPAASVGRSAHRSPDRTHPSNALRTSLPNIHFRPPPALRTYRHTCGVNDGPGGS